MYSVIYPLKRERERERERKRKKEKEKADFSDNKIIKRENKWLSYRHAHVAAASAFHFPMSCPNDVVCAHVYLDCSRPARYWRVPTSLDSFFLTFSPRRFLRWISEIYLGLKKLAVIFCKNCELHISLAPFIPMTPGLRIFGIKNIHVNVRAERVERN